MSISVVVPFFNRSSTLKRLLLSVNEQSIPIDELFIVDNGSDETECVAVAKIIERLNLPNITQITFVSTLRKFNANYARNLGLDLSTSTYVAFLDSDDWWEPMHIEYSISAMSDNVAAIYSGTRVLSGNGKFSTINSREITKNENPLKFLNSRDIIAQTSSFVVDKHKLNQVRWDESLSRHQDYDFFLAVATQTEGWGFKDSVTTNVDWSTWHASGRLKSLDFLMYFYGKWFSFAKGSIRIGINISKLLVLAECSRVVTRKQRNEVEELVAKLVTGRNWQKHIVKVLMHLAVTVAAFLLSKLNKNLGN